MNNYGIKDLEYWNNRIEEIVADVGLSCYPQEFEVVDYDEMINYEAYTGMPSRYPHWSFGKAWERTNTYYRYALTGLPYEMVINSNPCLAYLMTDNTLALQVLTMAHVYGHNDFFKNNRLFKTLTRAEITLETFKAHATRIRAYAMDPAIGFEKVEKLIDAAHALRLQTDRHLGFKRLTVAEMKERIVKDARPPESLYPELDPPREWAEPDTTRIPLKPEYDLLYFILTYGELEEWERDVINIVYEETSYFLPQIETKIMNEGWASYWHYTILNKLDLPSDLHMEFLLRHNMVVRPVVGGLNPYHLGFTIFSALARDKGQDCLFSAREDERDASFIRRYLTREIAEELHLFEYIRRGKNLVVNHLPDEEGFLTIRETLASWVGMGNVPVIRVNEVKKDRTLELEHEWDGRELELEYAHKTMDYLATLWKNKVKMSTRVNKQPTLLTADYAAGK